MGLWEVNGSDSFMGDVLGVGSTEVWKCPYNWGLRGSQLLQYSWWMEVHPVTFSRDAPTNPLHTAWVLASLQQGPGSGTGDPQGECTGTKVKLAQGFCGNLIPFQEFSAVPADEIWVWSAGAYPHWWCDSQPVQIQLWEQMPSLQFITEYFGSLCPRVRSTFSVPARNNSVGKASF